MKGVLLDSLEDRRVREEDALILDRAGRVLGSNRREILNADGVSMAMARNIEAGWNVGDFANYDILPDSVKGLVDRMKIGRVGFSTFQPLASQQTWEETLYSTIADGTAVTAAAETIMVPNYVLPANYMVPGRSLKYTVWYKQSTVITTPGTITLKMRWGGVSGTTLATSGAFAPDPTAASTNLSCCVQYYITCRAVGASGSLICMGRWDNSDYDDASATALKGNLDMQTIPTSAPAPVTTDTTATAGPTPTYTSSVATASMTALMGILESMS